MLNSKQESMMLEKRRRITAKTKRKIVLRMFRGEALGILSRELDIPDDRLTKWKEAFT
jgi:transposase-like protein